MRISQTQQATSTGHTFYIDTHEVSSDKAADDLACGDWYEAMPKAKIMWANETTAYKAICRHASRSIGDQDWLVLVRCDKKRSVSLFTRNTKS